MVEVIFLGIIQGITEYLPISSSGHLTIFYHLFQVNEPPILLQLYLHLGTALAVVIFLMGEIRKRAVQISVDLIKYLFIASIPAGIVGFFFRDELENVFSSPSLLPVFFLITTLLLFSTHYYKKGELSINKMGYWKSLFIGTLQALAVLPGVSRSGATIAGGLFIGLQKSAALFFSLLLSLIAITGGLLIEVMKSPSKAFSWDLILGFLTSFLVGYLSLALLKKVVLSNYFYVFGFYTLAMSILLWLMGPFI